MTQTELFEALRERRLIAGETPQIANDAGTSSPWFVQVMLGISAWFAGLLLFLFVAIGISRSNDHNFSLLSIGLVACAGAAGLYSFASPASVFAGQFAFAMSIGGQCCITIALEEMAGAKTALWTTLFFSVALIYVMQNRLHRLFSTLVASVTWGLATHEMLFGELPGLNWRSHENLYQNSWQSVVSWWMVWMPLGFGAYLLVTREAEWMAAGREKLLRPVTNGLIASLVIAPLATHPASFWFALGFGSAVEFRDGAGRSTAMWPLFAIFLALLAMALAFSVSNRPLMGVAIAFGLVEVSAFYYVLGTTLLVKSVVMIALGVVLFVFARLVERTAP